MAQKKVEKKKQRADGHATGMAGEFFVMEQLFRLGYTPALTLGNTKNIDILVKTERTIYEVSVKSVRKGGKWPVGKVDYTKHKNLIFVFLLYSHFTDVTTRPEVYIVEAPLVEKLKRPWHSEFAFYYSPRDKHNLEPYRESAALWEKTFK